MRVTDASMYAAMRKQVGKAREDFTKAHEVASSGLRVAKPSDDPVAAAAARRENARKALADAGKRATEHATMQLEGADQAIDDVFNGLTEARDLALEHSSATSNAENRRSAAVQVRKIRDQMVAMGNTNVAGRFIFAGYRDQAPPFTSNGEFEGDAARKEVQSMPGLKVEASISGSTVFGTDTEQSTFQLLDQLATALEEDDLDTLRIKLDEFGAHETRILGARSEVGSMLNSVEMAHNVADRYSARSQLEVSRLIAADEISAMTDLVQAKSALESALSVAKQIPVGSLVGGK